MLDHDKGWYNSRGKLYSELTKMKKFDDHLDSVYFYMDEPDMGCIDFSIFVNGKIEYEGMFSEIFDPFVKLRNWLEGIAQGGTPIYSLCINQEGPTLYLIYEVLEQANFYKPEIGVFYLYGNQPDDIQIKAIVNAKELVSAFYLAMLNFGGNTYNGPNPNFKEHWYCDANRCRRKHFLDNWTFYNTVKSPILDWFVSSRERYGNYSYFDFKKLPPIKETIQMWCDFGSELFWGRYSDGSGAGIGDYSIICTHTCGHIDLSSIEGLREWCNEYEYRELLDDGSEDLPEEWLKRGQLFARKVRTLLPDTIDLYFYYWDPEVEVINPYKEDWQFPERLPMIVENRRAIKTNITLVTT